MKKQSQQLVLFAELDVPLELPTSEADIYTRVELVTSKETVKKFIDLVAGLAVYIPASVDDVHWLTKALGKEDAQAICNLIANGFGVTMDFPMGENSLWARNRAKVAKMINMNIPANEIAASTGCSRRTVQRIKRRMIDHAKSSRSR